VDRGGYAEGLEEDLPIRESEMTKKGRQRKQARAAASRRVIWWIAGVFVLAVVAYVGYRSLNKATAPAGPDPAKLVGHWLRPDGGYILQLSEPGGKGELKAAYFNPRPINVSRAEWKHQEGHLGVFVELRDRNYPGSTYTLVYVPNRDQLAGYYYQAALGQTFDVVFVRQKKE
jgi:hypothetical protein